MRFQSVAAGEAQTVPAPDGSLVRILAQTPNASMARFELGPGEVSRAVRHRTVDELWYFVSGSGEMWRSDRHTESTVALAEGLSLSIPAGTMFQFRSGPGDTLVAVGVTIPPWPGESEAELVAGPWAAD